MKIINCFLLFLITAIIIITPSSGMCLTIFDDFNSAPYMDSINFFPGVYGGSPDDQDDFSYIVPTDQHPPPYTWWHTIDSYQSPNFYGEEFNITSKYDVNNNGFVTMLVENIIGFDTNIQLDNCTLDYSFQEFIKNEGVKWLIIDVSSNNNVAEIKIDGITPVNLFVDNEYFLVGIIDALPIPIPTAINPEQLASYLFDVKPFSYLEFSVAETPEPATILLFGTGLVGLVAVRRKRK